MLSLVVLTEVQFPLSSLLYFMTYCTSPLGSVGGSQFSSTPPWNTLVMVIFLDGDGSFIKSAMLLYNSYRIEVHYSVAGDFMWYC